MTKNISVWVGSVILVIVVALGLWWMSASQPASTTPTQTTSGAASIPTTDRSSSDVVSIAESISGASTFASWLASTGVAAQIKATGSYTIFVPTDGSISQLPAGTISSLTAAQKKRLVEYHVVSVRAIDVSAEVAGVIRTLSGDVLNFNFGTDKIPMVNSAIVVAEYKGNNGVVYLIDNVLIPPKATTI